jgi:hypothetical protein
VNVPGWSDKWIRMPMGAETDVIRVVAQGEPTTFQELVGNYRDEAVVRYAQDRSVLVTTPPTLVGTYGGIVDLDNSPGRWAVSFASNGRRILTVFDGRTGSHTQIPIWHGGSTFEVGNDVNGRFATALQGYFATSLAARNQRTVGAVERLAGEYRPDFEFEAEFLPWTEALDRAAAAGGHLATIASDVENDAVATVAAGKIAWIGATDSEREANDFYWASMPDEPFAYDNWKPGEPNNTGAAAEDCLVTNWFGGPGKWNDLFCDGKDSAGVTLVEGWVLETADGFEFVEGVVTWDQAVAAARARGGHLATIGSQAENDAVTAATGATEGGTKIAWIGATDKGRDANDFAWVQPAFAYTKWQPGEPNSGAGEDCLIIDARGVDAWNDEQCDPRFVVDGWVLEMAGNFEYVNERITWSEARDKAIARGGHLATIHSDAENQAVANAARGKVAWIGATDQGRAANDFAWVTETFSYVNWNAGEPNNLSGAGAGTEDCVVTNWDGAGLWNDMFCDGKENDKPRVDGYVVEFAERDYFENFMNFDYDWVSKDSQIHDTRLIVRYQMVTPAEDIFEFRPKFETFDTQVKVVEEKAVTRWGTAPIIGEQTVFTTARVLEPRPARRFGEFAADSVRSATLVSVSTGRDIVLSARVTAHGTDGRFELAAGRDVSIEGSVPADADPDVLAALAELTAQGSSTITAGENVNVADSGRVILKAPQSENHR